MSSFDWGKDFRVADLVTSDHNEAECHHHENASISVSHERGMGCDKDGNPVSVGITLMTDEDDCISIYLSTPQIMELTQRLIWDLENYGLEYLESEEEEEEEEE